MGCFSPADSSPQRPLQEPRSPKEKPSHGEHVTLTHGTCSCHPAIFSMNSGLVGTDVHCHGLSVHCPPQTVVFRHLDPSWFPIWKVKQLNKEDRENNSFQSLGAGRMGRYWPKATEFQRSSCNKYPILWTVFKCLWNLAKFTMVLCHLGA